MRVVSWNMGLNGPRFSAPGKHDQAWHFLLGLGPDLAFLQECLPPTWARGSGQLICGPIAKWGSVVFSPRYPLAPVRLPERSRLRALGSYLAIAEACLPDGTEALVASVHARDAEATQRQLGTIDPATIKRPSLPAAKVNDLVFSELAGVTGPRFIVGGDWNTGRTQSSKTAGVEFFDRAQQAGWHDCVDSTEGEIQTWFGRGTLIQNDHVFCDRSLGEEVQAAWAAEDAAVRLGLSDHAPLVIDVEMKSIAMTNLRPDTPDGPSPGSGGVDPN